MHVLANLNCYNGSDVGLSMKPVSKLGCSRDHESAIPPVYHLNYLPVGLQAQLVMTWKSLIGLEPRYLKDRLFQHESALGSVADSTSFYCP